MVHSPFVTFWQRRTKAGMLLFSPPARHFVIPRVLPSFYHGVSGHCVISCMEKSQTFSRNGATGRGKLRERPEKIAPLPFFVLFSEKRSMIRDPIKQTCSAGSHGRRKSGVPLTKKEASITGCMKIENETIFASSNHDTVHGTGCRLRPVRWMKRG